MLTEANGNLSKEKRMINDAIRAVEERVFQKLQIDWDVDLLVTNRLRDIIIPEDGVGGRAISSDFAELAIDEGRATENLISEILAHELCHAARWGKNDEWASSLLDNIICEGIATYFEAKYAANREERTVFIKTVLSRSDDENMQILKRLQDQLGLSSYNYNDIFFDGNNKLPRWSGYSLGYYLVKKYLEITGKKIEDAFADEYGVFKYNLEAVLVA